jgi:hypothetical protein
MHMENRLKRISRATVLAGAVLLVAALPASATSVGGSSGTGPAMVEFDGTLCVAWSGTDSHHHLNIACADPNQGGFQTQVTDQLSAFAPALAVYHNALWMAWTGTDSNHTLNVAQVNPFTGSTTLSLEAYVVGDNDASSQAPALAVAEVEGVEQLVIAWTGTDSHHHLNVASSVNVNPSNAWSGTFTLNQLATGGPSLATFNSILYIGWSGTDGNHTLNLASNAVNGLPSNSLSFGAAQPVNIPGRGNFTSPSAPSLTNTANLNYGWRGGDNSINIEYYSDPANPSALRSMGAVPGISTGAPLALATFNGVLWVGWIDLHNNLQVEQVP